MASRKTKQQPPAETGATGFEDDFDNDFLSWNPGSIKSSLSLDFDDDTPSPNVQKSFPVSKLDMDMDFDAGFSKLLSFDIDIPFGDGSPHPKKKTPGKRGNACTSPPTKNRRQQNDVDMFADDLTLQKTSENGPEVAAHGSNEAFMSEATNFSQKGQSTSARIANDIASKEEGGSAQDDVANAADPHSDTENIRRPEEGRGLPEKPTAGVPVLSQPETDSSKDVSLSQARSGSVHPEDASPIEVTAEQKSKPHFVTKVPMCQATSRNLYFTNALQTTPEFKAETSGLSLLKLKPILAQKSELLVLDKELKKPDSKPNSICPDADPKAPKGTVKLISVSVPDAKVYKQTLAKISVTGGDVKDFLQRSSSPGTKGICGTVLGQRGQNTAPAVTTKGKRKLSPTAVHPDTKKLEAQKLMSNTHLDVVVPPSCGGASLDNRKLLKLHVGNLGRRRPIHQGAKGTSLLKQQWRLPVPVPKPLVVRDRGQVSQRSSYFTRLSETKTSQVEAERSPRQRGLQPSVDKSNSQKYRACQHTVAVLEGGHIMKAKEDIKHPTTERQSVATIPASIQTALGAELVKTPPAQIDQHSVMPQDALISMCTGSAEMAVKLEKDLDHFEKMLKSTHEGVKDLLVRACLLTSSWVTMNNPMEDLKIKEIEEYISSRFNQWCM